jgi:hypothetical protein
VKQLLAMFRAVSAEIIGAAGLAGSVTDAGGGAVGGKIGAGDAAGAAGAVCGVVLWHAQTTSTSAGNSNDNRKVMKHLVTCFSWFCKRMNDVTIPRNQTIYAKKVEDRSTGETETAFTGYTRARRPNAFPYRIRSRRISSNLRFS